MENSFQKEQSNKITNKHRVVKNFTVKFNQQRTRWDKTADFLTSIFGGLPFVLIHVAWFAIWFAWNWGWIPGVEPFDFYPYGLLTAILSLEAIFLAIFVLVSQNRSSKIDQLRSEVDLQVDLSTEQEITKILKLLKVLMGKNGINLDDDKELTSMLKPIDEWVVERKLEKQLEAKPKKNLKSK